MTVLFSRLVAVPRKYPVVRGIVSYAVLWPTSSVIQQTMERKNPSDPINWAQAFRFGLFGSCFVAPTLFIWMRFATKIWPGKDLMTAVKKALVEQVTYGPCAMMSFYFGMSALEMKPFDACVEEVKVKAWPTFKVAVCFWPVVQTFNAYFVPERNRVVVLSFVSLLWTIFLAHMKSLHKEQQESQQVQNKKNY